MVRWIATASIKGKASELNLLLRKWTLLRKLVPNLALKVIGAPSITLPSWLAMLDDL